MDKDKLKNLKNAVSCLFDSSGNPDYDCLSEVLFLDPNNQGNVIAAIPMSAVQSMVHYLIENDKLEEVLQWNNKVFSKQSNSLGDFTEDEFVQFDSHQISESEEVSDDDNSFIDDDDYYYHSIIDDEEEEPVIH
jgi:hypothetical protein